MKAQKKPVVIDYFHFTGRLSSLVDWVSSCSQDFEEHFEVTFDLINKNRLFIKTLEGTSYEVTEDDFIIRGVKGEYYPCKKDIFYQKYDLL